MPEQSAPADRARRLPADQRDVRRDPSTGSLRSSTGRWPRSATRSPTSGCSSSTRTSPSRATWSCPDAARRGFLTAAAAGGRYAPAFAARPRAAELVRRRSATSSSRSLPRASTTATSPARPSARASTASVTQVPTLLQRGASTTRWPLIRSGDCQMDFAHSERSQALQARVARFLDESRLSGRARLRGAGRGEPRRRHAVPHPRGARRAQGRGAQAGAVEPLPARPDARRRALGARLRADRRAVRTLAARSRPRR